MFSSPLARANHRRTFNRVAITPSQHVESPATGFLFSISFPNVSSRQSVRDDPVAPQFCGKCRCRDVWRFISRGVEVARRFDRRFGQTSHRLARRVDRINSFLILTKRRASHAADLKSERSFCPTRSRERVLRFWTFRPTAPRTVVEISRAHYGLTMSFAHTFRYTVDVRVRVETRSGF